MTVLDGGLATELEARGHDLSDRLWSARLLLSEPARSRRSTSPTSVREHVAITASYQASVEGFAAAGLDRPTALEAIRRSVELAQRARSGSAKKRRPPAATRAACSSRDRWGRTARCSRTAPNTAATTTPATRRSLAFHRPRIDALVAAGADLLAVETIPTLREARVSSGCSMRPVSQPGSRTPVAMAPDRRRRAVRRGDRAWLGPRAMSLRWASIAPPRSTCARCSRSRGPRRPPAHCLSEPATRGIRSRTWRSDKAGSWEPTVVASWTALGAVSAAVAAQLADIERLAAAVGGRVRLVQPPVDDLFGV